MICIDTTVLIDQFRAGDNREAAVNRALLAHGDDKLMVPVVVAGEFLDGAAMASPKRLEEAARLLMGCELVSIDFEIACCYGRLTADLRKRKQLSGRSQNNLWIAATAVALKAVLLTRNAADFEPIPGLQVVAYGG